MRSIPNAELEKMRQLHIEASLGANGAGTSNGVFAIKFGDNVLRMIASDTRGWAAENLPLPAWEHVSVTVQGKRRYPTWEETCAVKDLFWEPEELVIQLHPPKSQWISNNPWCLHLWKPVGVELPLPPSICVGIQHVGEIRDEAHAREVREKFLDGRTTV